MAALLCVAGGGITLRLAVAAFSLTWSHTIEHTRWREDWRVQPAALHLDTAAVQGSGAGMEPGPGAQLIAGMWVWHPRLDVPELLLRRAAEAGDWSFCTDPGGCRPLGGMLPANADPVRLWPCGVESGIGGSGVAGSR